MKILIALTLILLNLNCFATTYLVRTNDVSALSEIGSFKKFTKFNSKYFRSLYEVESKMSVSDILKNKKIISVETITEIKGSSIEPADISTNKTSDPYAIFQWGYDFQNQKVINEITDLDNFVIKGKKEADIGFSSIENVDLKFKKDVLVAVIDTGVDYNHPDLKDNIFQNTVECENGEIPFGVTESKDSNEYPGDCKGWNFTGSKELGTNRPEDYVGHGTHISGIIAAVKNNTIGVSGISNKIKILPIKVLSNKNEDSQALGTSDRLTKAILYAIDMKADVINLSLGWPLSFDKEHLREAVNAAIKNGVTVVSASGNNDHSEPIMPCAYEGIIYVGSSDPNGDISDFSNYGAHVDVLAPGNNILSTYPTANTPLFFDVNGYEIKSGTSQATPYVSALVATIKGIYPNISERELYGRVFNTQRNLNTRENKFSTHGIINFNKSIAEKPIAVWPVFKDLNRVLVDSKNKSFKFKVKIARSETKGDLSARILTNKNIKLSHNEFKNFGDEIEVEGVLSDLGLDLQQNFILVLNLNGVESEYRFQKRFYVEFSELENISNYKIVGANPKTLTSFATLNYQHTPYDFPYYYTESSQKEDIILSVFTKVGDVIRPLGTTFLKNAKSLLSVHRIDANFDGNADIVVRYLKEVKKDDSDEVDTSVVYAYMTEQLRPLFTEIKTIDGKEEKVDNSLIELKFEGIILQDLNDFVWGKSQYGNYGLISVPVFMIHGETPAADSNPNPFSRMRKRVFSANIYYFQPVIEEGKSAFITRTFSTNKFIDRFKKEINFNAFEQIFMVKFQVQSFDDIDKGEFKVLVSHESERKLPRNYNLTVTSLDERTWNLSKIDGSNLNLSEFIPERAIDLDAKTLLPHDIDRNLIGFEKFSRFIWNEFMLNGDSIDYVSVEQENFYDPLEYPIKTYLSRDGTFRFYLTPSKIYLEKSDEHSSKTIYSYPVHVSSFLPGMLFREQHYPISFRESGINKPALYVDSTQISSRNIYIISEKNGELVAPVKFHVNIPENCKALNPVVIEKDKYEYSIQCFEANGGSSIHYLPLMLK